jgi:NADH-quinone oxidoreductase subunit K
MVLTILANGLLIIGFSGLIIARYNLVLILLSLDLLYYAVSLLYISAGISAFDLQGQIFAFYLIAIAASETAIGLGLLTIIYRQNNTVNLVSTQFLRG